ncbi:DinB family protein [Nocardioides sp. ChNu-153]|nr:DinB family protein [Nocardioides sp. ChNu-99]MDN7120225.1 DinB family protein [Nocardioides sp. ChNu-153]
MRSHREAVLWKLEGLPERDQRWPATPSGTNLLGLVKHLAFTEAGYFGLVFGRPPHWAPQWVLDIATGADEEPNSDMWARPDESPEELVALYRRMASHSDDTIAALPLDAPGRVPWWGEQGDTTLHHVLVHMIAETARHAGHADVVREGIDGARGLAAGNDNLPDADEAWWDRYVDRLRDVAQAADG